MAYPIDEDTPRRHSAHWGAFNAVVEDGKLVGVEPFEHDPSPSQISNALPECLYAETRIRCPAVRKSWLEHGPGARTAARGCEPFVEVSWDQAFDLVSAELKRVKDKHGNESIFGGSYGWSSAGRFQIGLQTLAGPGGSRLFLPWPRYSKGGLPSCFRLPFLSQ